MLEETNFTRRRFLRIAATMVAAARFQLDRVSKIAF
jgi:hypothetical protein